MSEQTLDALDQAIRAYIAEQSPGDLVAGWFLVATTVLPDDDDASGYWYEKSPQPIHATLGLIDMAREHLHRQINEEEA